jgi:hypothetical protein
MIRFLFTAALCFLLLHIGTYFGLVIEKPALTAALVILFSAIRAYATRPPTPRREP